MDHHHRLCRLMSTAARWALPVLDARSPRELRYCLNFILSVLNAPKSYCLDKRNLDSNAVSALTPAMFAKFFALEEVSVQAITIPNLCLIFLLDRYQGTRSQ